MRKYVAREWPAVRELRRVRSGRFRRSPDWAYRTVSPRAVETQMIRTRKRQGRIRAHPQGPIPALRHIPDRTSHPIAVPARRPCMGLIRTPVLPLPIIPWGDALFRLQMQAPLYLRVAVRPAAMPLVHRRLLRLRLSEPISPTL